MHDADRECARSIVCNLKKPDPATIKNNPYLNKVPKKEPMINLHTSDLLSIAQITPNKYEKYKNFYENEVIVEECLEKKKQSPSKLIESPVLNL